jgi:phytanoyl-CoA hydroxylase
MYHKESKIFLDDGVVFIKNFISKEIIEECRNDLEKFQDYDLPMKMGHAVFEDTKTGNYLKYFQHIQLYIPSFLKLYNSRLFDVAKTFFNQELYFSPMGLHNKVPNFSTETPMHQDNFYSCLKPTYFATAYVPLERMSKENGGLTYVKKSHLNGVQKHGSSKMRAFSSAIDQKDFLEENFFTPTFEIGDIAFHHGDVVHFANKNVSQNNRRAVAIGIFGVNAKIDKDLQKNYLENLKFNKENS